MEFVVREAGAGDERNTLPFAHTLTDFAPIPSLIQKISQLEARTPGERAYEISRMQLEPTFQLLEQLAAGSLIVYAPPKVGGQTIAATLWQHPGLPEPRHVHFLTRPGIAFMDSQAGRCRFPLQLRRWYESIAVSRWVRTALNVRNSLRASGLGSILPKPVLVAAVREPVAQYLSLVFEHWWMYADSPTDLTAEVLLSQMRTDPWREQCANWFTSELGEVFGLNVLARPFPVERGWDVYENDRARLPAALGELLGIDPANVALVNRNVADEKDYSDQYASVKKFFRPPYELLQEVYSHPQVRHFYSPGEIVAFQQMWQTGNAVERCSRPPSPEPRANPDRPRGINTLPLPGVREAANPSETKPGKHPHHPMSCRPCPQCTEELRSVPLLHRTCQERLELIQKMDGMLHSRRPFLSRCRDYLGRMFRG
jgi:hypothetical protein